MTEQNNSNLLQRCPSKEERRCVHCRHLFKRQSLIRILKPSQANEIVKLQFPGESSISTRLFGRSAYVCDTHECLQGAIKGRKLHKTLKCALEGDIVSVLQSRLNQLES